MENGFKFLSSNEKTKLFYYLERYGIKAKKLEAYEFLIKNNSVYLINREMFEIIEKIGLANLINIGFYLGKIEKSGEKSGFMLSFDACQLFSDSINLWIEIDKEKLSHWFFGLPLKIDEKIRNQIEAKKIREEFVVLKHGADLVGVGLVKGNKILNYVPKERRLRKALKKA